MANYLPQQWPTFSLSAGEANAVATVSETAIALCLHWQFAPKWLSPLIITDLVLYAPKLGDGQKIEPTCFL